MCVCVLSHVYCIFNTLFKQMKRHVRADYALNVLKLLI